MKKAISDSHDVSRHPVQIATVTERDQTPLLAEILVGLVVSKQCDVNPCPLGRDPYYLCTQSSFNITCYNSVIQILSKLLVNIFVYFKRALIN